MERFNKTLIQVLEKITDGEPARWDVCLPAAVHWYNNKPCTTSGLSPYRVLFGQDCSISERLYQFADVQGALREAEMTAE